MTSSAEQRLFIGIFFTGLLWFLAEGARVNKKINQTLTQGSQEDEMMLNSDPPMSSIPSKTAKGCTCKTNGCKTSSRDHYKCEWCKVTDKKCGKWSFFGRWDYCVRPAMSPYEAQTADQKTKQMWKKITAPDVVGKSAEAPSVLKVIKGVVGQSMRANFDTHWDMSPVGRTKSIHSQGVHCQFELDVGGGDTSYTGLFSKGKQHGIIRLGSATSLGVMGILPGMALKFPRSGVTSGNFFALRSSGDGGKSYAFFDQPFSKITAPPKALQMLGKFAQASGCASQIGLSEMCSYNQDGTAVPAKDVKFPYDLIIEAHGTQVYLSSGKKKNAQLLDELSAIPSGTTLFYVYAKESPRHEKKLLGTIKTISKCVKSLFGDKNLFFKHQRMEEDFALRPEWIKQVKATGSCKPSAKPSSKWQCPGAPQSGTVPVAVPRRRRKFWR